MICVLDLARLQRNSELRGVSLRLREKQSLYHNFGRLLRAGITFGKALESLSKTSRGRPRQVILALKQSILGGLTIADSFAQLRPAISEMEVGIISAVERTGRLEHGFAQLAEYFGALDQARSNIIKKTAYPVFVLLLGVLTLNLKVFLMVMFKGGGIKDAVSAYSKHTLITLAVIGISGLAIFFISRFLNKAAARNAAIDHLLLRLPLFGKMRRAFALSRFCATFEMQLDASVNILDGLESAERASQSGMIRAAVETGLPKLREGIQPSQLFAESNAFPDEMVQAYTVAEESGELEHELKRLAMEYRAESFNRLEIVVEWIAKLLYFGVVVYVAYGLISFYSAYLNAVMKIGE
jgi:type II secretory pathway component PulF